MTNIIPGLNELKDIASKLQKPGVLNPGLVDEFNSVFKEATAAVGNISGNELEKKRAKQISDQTSQIDKLSLERLDKSYLAQLNPVGVNENAENANTKELNIVPLQIFLDNAIKSLEQVSQQEFRMNNLIDGFVQGKVSEDEVVLETAKLNLSISMVTTIVQSAVQTFKEIQQIPV
ncbi:MAG: flagellar hook-basal body complex protein FliE [Candidatus Margulisiibacteriota bacterium]